MDSELNVLNTKLSMLHEDVNDIKSALKTLSDAITKLALVEARQVQSDAALERAFKAIEKIETRLEKSEYFTAKNQQASDWVYRAVWACSAAVGVYILKTMKVL